MAGYPQAKFRYKVEIDGLEAGGFSEVTGFDATIEAIEYREGDMTAETPMKIPGLKKYGNITLKQGVTDSRVLFDWITTGINGAIERKTLTITLLNETQSPAASSASFFCSSASVTFGTNTLSCSCFASRFFFIFCFCCASPSPRLAAFISLSRPFM